MWLERQVIQRAEARLRPYRVCAESFQKENDTAYQQYLPQITALYAQATHWHGTGRYHYQHQSGSRYDGVREDVVVDVLSAILEFDGLMPHADPWIDSGDKTVSLATVRMFARAFARIHASEKDMLVYELGGVEFWLRLYFIFLFLWLCGSLRKQIPFIKSLCRRTFFQDIRSWEGAMRKPDGKKSVSILDVFRDEIPTSDISGNYPILIGMNVSSKDLIDTIPLTHKVEQRSLKPISLKQWTHIEVPLQKVALTEEILAQKGIVLPVIPLEFVDVYLSSLPLEKLAYV